jgi:hypothetical protein
MTDRFSRRTRVQSASAFLGRTPDPDSKQTLLEQYAQILLSTNGEIFWP